MAKQRGRVSLHSALPRPGVGLARPISPATHRGQEQKLWEHGHAGCAEGHWPLAWPAHCPAPDRGQVLGFSFLPRLAHHSKCAGCLIGGGW